jgi:hypothetical protein
MLGCRRCKGQDWHPSRALTTELILNTVRAASIGHDEAITMEETNRLLVFIIYSIVTYMMSLRGSEGFLLDFGGIIRHM